MIRHGSELRDCYEQALQEDTSLEGDIVAHLTIGSSGTVDSLSLEGDTLGSQNLESCVLRELGRMRFPEIDGESDEVTVTLEYRQEND